MNKRLIIPRDSTEEVTFAVVDFAGCAEDELLGKLKLAVAEWAAETAEGADAVADGDFNIGDLADCPATLDFYLERHDIYFLDVEVYSQDGRLPHWSFDTKLYEG